MKTKLTIEQKKALKIVTNQKWLKAALMNLTVNAMLDDIDCTNQKQKAKNGE